MSAAKISSQYSRKPLSLVDGIVLLYLGWEEDITVKTGKDCVVKHVDGKDFYCRVRSGCACMRTTN